LRQFNMEPLNYVYNSDETNSGWHFGDAEGTEVQRIIYCGKSSN
jgi:hypothetical protein